MHIFTIDSSGFHSLVYKESFEDKQQQMWAEAMGWTTGIAPNFKLRLDCHRWAVLQATK
jgi:hypothetical protein